LWHVRCFADDERKLDGGESPNVVGEAGIRGAEPTGTMYDYFHQTLFQQFSQKFLDREAR